MKLLLRILLILFSLPGLQIFSQSEIKFDNYTMLDGLSNGTVQRIRQDVFGYIWIGTNDGLNRYDGYDFKVYREDSEIPNSILGNLVIEIYEDSNNDIWIGTEKALNLYNRDTDDFTVFQYDASQSTLFYNGVLSILEDSKGIFWIGKALHGLTKFNRETQQFEQYLIDSNQVGAQTTAIFDLEEDSEGKLWFMEGNNFNLATDISILSADRKEFQSLKDSLISMTGLDQFNNFITYHDNNIFINTLDGYSLKIDIETLAVTQNEIVEKSPIFRMAIDPYGNYWYASPGKGLIKVIANSGKKVIYNSSPQNSNSIISNNPIEIYIDETGVFWVGTGGSGISKFDPSKIVFNKFVIPINENQFESITDIAFSEKFAPKLWIASFKGLQLFDPRTSKIEDKITRIDSLNNTQVRTVVERDNKLWVGTWGKGLFEIDLDTWRYQQYLPNTSDGKSIVSPFVRTLNFDTNSNLWLGNDVGLNKLDVESKNIQSYKVIDTSYTRDVWKRISDLRKSQSTIAEITKVGDNANLTKRFKITSPIRALVTSTGETFALQDGTLWDYGWIEDENGNTIWKFDSLNNSHAGGDLKNRISSDVISLQPGNYKLRFISDDSHSADGWNASVLLYPEYWGIQLYALTDELADYFSKNLKIRITGQSIPGENIQTLYDDGNGKLWIGTNNSGFGYYDYINDKYKNFNSESKSVTNYSSDRVNSFLLDSKGRFWIASFGGLLLFNQENETIKKITVNNGLPSNYLMDLIEDHNGDIWISSLSGLIKFNPNTDKGVYTFNSYDINDGLQDFNFIQGSSFKSSDGKLYFGGMKGFNSFIPGNENKFAPKIVINNLLLSNKNVRVNTPDSPLLKNISLTDSLVLNYSQNDFSFEYTAIHYSRPEKNKYAYMLQRFDDDWIYDNRRFASYTNLDPGEYEFKVKAANYAGIWSHSPKVIKINIQPPWWATTWAYIIYSLVLIFTLIGFNKVQKKRILTKERERQKIQEAELRAVAAEAQARAIQAENDRKTKELEEARQLQLSMLPVKLPDLPNIDIAVYMSTATEVGGDYYDFHIDIDGTLTVVVGDATGHGLNAGTVVTATKSLFSTHATNSDILFTFGEISRCLKELRMRLLSMCLMILKIKRNKLIMSAAGMPPALIFRNNGKLEELLIKGMPLGTPASFPYEVKETLLSSGDTILLMSDGYPELFNEKNEMLGYASVYETFKEIGNKSAEEIIIDLRRYVDEWKGNREQDDDITFVVLKIK